MATVLIVEDEEAIREVLQSRLEARGHRVITAGAGAEALEILARLHDHRVDLLLTDMTLPGMPGLELAQTVSRTRSQIKVFLMSGHALDHIVTGKGWHYIQKPFDPSELVRYVDSMFGSPA